MFDLTPLQATRGTLLDDAAVKTLSDLSTELADTWEKRQIWRTDTEARYSILNDLHFPTAASKYWQAVREQAVFLENLAQLARDYRRNDVELRRLAARLEREQLNEFERELLEIDLEEKQFNARSMEIQAKDRLRELKMWSDIKAELDDGSFNTGDVNEHQLISYGQRFAVQMATTNLAACNVGEQNNLVGQFARFASRAAEIGKLDEMLAPIDPAARAALVARFAPQVLGHNNG